MTLPAGAYRLEAISPGPSSTPPTGRRPPRVRTRRVGLLARRGLVAAAQVLAADDAVAVPAAHPVQELVGAPDGHRVGEVEHAERVRDALRGAGGSIADVGEQLGDWLSKRR